MLDEPTYRVGVVCAPAGFGKTALLVTWAAGSPDHTAWLSCDESDHESARFWTGLLAALSARWTGVSDDAAIELERCGSDSHELAIALANDMGQVAGVKHAAKAGQGEPIEQAIAIMMESHWSSVVLPDRVEGIRAWNERREPVFPDTDR